MVGKEIEQFMGLGDGNGGRAREGCGSMAGARSSASLANLTMVVL